MTIRHLLRKSLRLLPFLRHHFYLRFNRILFRLNGAEFGRNMRIFDSLYLIMRPGARLFIGDNFVFSSGSGINPLCRNIRGEIFIDSGAEIHIGNNSGISSGCLWAKQRIKIGNNVLIGGDCILMDTDAHNLDWQVRAGIVRDKSGGVISDCKSAISEPIGIGDNVLVGTRSIILKGVTIGARTIIAAGSVVTKSIPADCIAGGNPAKVIRYINGKQS